jgi:ABC-type dipeptide/oligopeptide/nickel transport system permease subunit
MSTPATLLDESFSPTTHASPTRILANTWRFIRTKPLGAIGFAIIAFFIVVAIFAPVFAREDPNLPLGGRYEKPNSTYWFGTDDLGRDYYSRIVYGSRISMQVGAIAMSIGVGFGLILGLISGYFLGLLDLILQRILDAMMAIPGLILALALVSVFDPGVRTTMVALGIVLVPGVARITRGSTLAVKDMPYVEASRAIGASDLRLMIRHVLPNIVAPLIVIFTTGLGTIILAEAGLSFLGVGTPPPTPSWGRMLVESRAIMTTRPWLSIIPGITISLVVMGFNLAGDAIRDVTDPRLRRL